MTARANTRSQIKALLWEESRVGGTIVLTSLVVAVLLLLQTYRMFGSHAWIRDEMMVQFAALGIPLLTAVMLILNPDYSGHLTGGFSKRILRYPVQTPIAVAVSLGARTFLMFVMSALLLALASALFLDTPGIAVVGLVTGFYLVAQLIDWLRGPLRGLSSLIVLGLVAIVLGYFIWPDMPNFTPIRWTISLAQRSPMALPIVVPLLVAAVYAVAAPMVHLDRIGRSFGIPEIWEWPRSVSVSGRTNFKPFLSPMAAQVWFELRRAKWLLPISALLMLLVYLAAIWIRVRNNSFRGDDGDALRVVLSLGVFVAVVLGAAVHGVQVRVLGLRRKARMSGYEYMQPLTDAQFATARLLAGALLLVPTLAVALALHFAVAGHYFVAVLLPDALRLGIVSPREAVWMVLSRGLFVGLLGWIMLAIGTRYFRIALGFILSVFTILVIIGITVDENVHNVEALLVWVVAIVPMVFTAALVRVVSRDLKLGAISSRTCGGWLLAWALLAWLFHYALFNAWPAFTLSPLEIVIAINTAIGCSALFPLVYFAVLDDLRRRRLENQVAQDPAQHRQRFSWVHTIAMAGVSGFVLWLGWPVTPEFIQYRKQHDLPWPDWSLHLNPVDVSDVPLTSKSVSSGLVEPVPFDLGAAYPEPPAGTNVAPAYIEIADESGRLQRTYYASLEAKAKAEKTHDWIDYPKKYLLIVGGAEMPSSGPIEKGKWKATEAYWAEVTSKVAPALKELATRDTRNSRYPVKLDRWRYELESAEVSRVRSVDRQLELDALHWTVAGNPAAAAESALAMIPLANSLAGVPIEWHQWGRLTMVRSVVGSVEALLNRSTPDDALLRKLDEGLAGALPDLGRNDGLRRSIEWGTVSLFRIMGGSEIGPPRQPNFIILFGQLGFPTAAQATIVSLQEHDVLAHLDRPWPSIASAINGEALENYYRGVAFMYPALGRYLPDRGRAAEQQITAQTFVDMGRAALAIERFRLANDRLPGALADLVPAFLDQVPDDAFAGDGVPLRYLVRDSGEYIVYSVGPDMNDDRGEKVKEIYSDRDIVFTVAPMSVRTGPQVAE